MASCKDCLSADICYRYKDPCGMPNLFNKYFGGVTCPNFIDRERFVELPCKVSDRIYTVGKFYDGIVENYVHHFEIFEDYIGVYSDPWDGEICKAHQIGKIVDEEVDWNGYFLTREEAEKALKERENNGW